MSGDQLRDAPLGEIPSNGGLPPTESRWTPRILLLVPALTQITIAYFLVQELQQNRSAAGLLVLLILLALGGAGGIAAGVFGPSRRFFHVGVLCALLGFAVPAAIHTVATPVDQDTSVVLGLAHYDAEGLGTLVFFRMLVELPFWGLYVIISIVSYLASRP